jgi:hypothetical protein
MAQGLCDTFQTTERFDSCQHMGGIAALTATSGCRQPCSLAWLSSVSKSSASPPPWSSLVRNSHSTEKSKPRSSSSKRRAYFQSIRVRTASAACLSESTPNELQHRDQRQSPGGFSWLPLSRKEGSEQFILKDCAQLISSPNAHASFRTNDARKTSGWFGNRREWFGFERHPDLLCSAETTSLFTICVSLQFLTWFVISPTGSCQDK